MPVLIYAFYRVNTYYKNVAEQLRLEDGAQLHEFDGNTVIVLVGNVTKANVGALNYARSIGDYVVAMHVSMDENVEKEKKFRKSLKTLPGRSSINCPFFVSFTAKSYLTLC